MSLEFSDDVCPTQREPRAAVTIELSVAEQRKIVEAEVKGPAFRMWLTPAEYEKIKDFTDWTMYPLRDGRVAVWRSLASVKAITHTKLYLHIMSRKLDDNII